MDRTSCIWFRMAAGGSGVDTVFQRTTHHGALNPRIRLSLYTLPQYAHRRRNSDQYCGDLWIGHPLRLVAGYQWFRMGRIDRVRHMDPSPHASAADRAVLLSPAASVLCGHAAGHHILAPQVAGGPARLRAGHHRADDAFHPGRTGEDRPSHLDGRGPPWGGALTRSYGLGSP